MKLAAVLETLKNAEGTLRPRGVVHAGVFGSVARGESGPESDVDIAVEFDRAARITLWDYAAVQEIVSELFDGPVDVVDRAGLKPSLRDDVERDLVNAF